jgi:predicted porin
MKSSCLVVLAFSACAASAYAQTNEVYRVAFPTLTEHHGIKLTDVDNLLEPGSSDSATRVFGYPGKRMGLSGVAEPRRLNVADGFERDQLSNRAWGVSLGAEAGLFAFRVAHQNKNVAKVAPAMPLGNRMDAKNSIIAVNVDLGLVKAYTAYSANRGWGSSPLWNPDNPYGAQLASTPSTDSRDVLVGMALPLTRQTTLLASFVRKNDRDLANRDADQFAFGATYTVSRSTDFYAAWSHTEFRNGAGYMAVSSPLGRASSAVNVGMRHSF